MKINFDYFKDKKNIAWIAFFALLLIAMIVMSVGAGMNGDEEMQATHAGNVLIIIKVLEKIRQPFHYVYKKR